MGDSTLEKLLEEIEDLREAKRLLEKIWLELDPYNSGHRHISNETWRRVQVYFKFDDSE